MKKNFDRRVLTGERSVNFLIRWLTEKSINGDAETPIDGHKLTVTGTGRIYFKCYTSIFTYRLINQLIDQSDEQNGQRDTSFRYQTSGRIT